MNIIDGKLIAKSIREKLKEEVSHFEKKPGLAFILIGEDPASHAYVRMKKRACLEVGIHSESYFLDANISEQELLDLIQSCNNNPDIHGILVQQPLPKHISTKKVIETISEKKDVDGFHPINIGKALLGEEDGFLPCTPYGILELLKSEKIDLTGKHVVILGRSNIVGKPLASMVVQKKTLLNATVTLVHSKTKNLKDHCSRADVLIAAIGVPNFVTQDMIKPGAVVIDVGINRIEVDGKSLLVGDVNFENVKGHCSSITPVPGGVGPMTIAMLLKNTVLGFKKSCAGSS